MPQRRGSLAVMWASWTGTRGDTGAAGDLERLVLAGEAVGSPVADVAAITHITTPVLDVTVA